MVDADPLIEKLVARELKRSDAAAALQPYSQIPRTSKQSHNVRS